MTERAKPEGQPFPLVLERVVFTKCLVAAVPGHVPSEDSGALEPSQNTINVTQNPEQARTYVAQMRTVLNPNREKSHPYQLDLECVAIFTADESLTDDEAKRGVTITGNNVCYGAIRETVAYLTSRQPYGTFMLGLSVLPHKVENVSAAAGEGAKAD